MITKEAIDRVERISKKANAVVQAILDEIDEMSESEPEKITMVSYIAAEVMTFIEVHALTHGINPDRIKGHISELTASNVKAFMEHKNGKKG